MTKKSLGKNVYEAAVDRISYVFDNFPRVYLSFSGGKDSTVMLHMVADEVLRLKQITGLAELFSSEEFSEAWEVVTEDQNMI